MDRLYSFLLSVVVGVTTHYVIKWLDRHLNSDN
ncbi:putative PurR-regulated permease PerM [Anaerococcus degeneri]|nr:putative PurR-regulated permease PerM [Anaerococcus degeneri]